MIILDTNVVSEAWKATPNTATLAWMDAQPSESLYLCTPVLAELRYGVERLPAGSRKERLRSLMDKLEGETFQGRIFPLDTAAAAQFGRLAARRESEGRRMQPMDALIAAIALSQAAGLATRDVHDFADLGLKLINPFEKPAPAGGS
jgi:predicted nucleic acid-binding protein